MTKINNKLTLIINGESYPMHTEKQLIGSAHNSDIIALDSSISYYHAIIFAKENGSIEILDLESSNGTYINGERIYHKSPLFEGDSLTLGKLHCQVIESPKAFDFHTQEKEVEVYKELQENKVIVPQQANETDILIDDEYCDIIFDDKDFEPLQENPLSHFKIDTNEFIETEDLEQAFDILEATNGDCIQVTTTLNGSLLEQYYYPLADGVIRASQGGAKNSVQIDLLESKKPIPLFKIQDSKIVFEEINHFTQTHSVLDIESHEVAVLSCGTYQVFVEKIAAPDNFIHISSMRRDKDFFKDTTKKFAAAILPMLLLLLVDFSIEKKEPLKQLSIVYKKPTKTKIDGKKLTSTETNNKKQNNGHKQTKQNEKKVAHSKSGQKAIPKKQPKKVAKAQSKPKAKAAPKSPKVAKTKSYNFKTNSNMKSIFSTSKSVNVAAASQSSATSTSSATTNLNTKVNGTSSSNIGNMGSDAAGRSLASFGSKGLSSKSGRDTSYIQTKTVVLGSMDPELLRKVLQQYLPQFRHCYQQELVYNSEDIKGIVDLNFEITGSGKVSKVKVRAKDSRFSKRGTDCMANVLAVIDFPKPKGGGRVAVRQPLSFYSEKERS